MIQRLEWDSAFFERIIGKVTIKDKIGFDKFISLETKLINGYDLIYLFCDSGSVVNTIVHNRYVDEWVDKRVGYHKVIEVDKKCIKYTGIRKLEKYETDIQLEELAFLSGKYSRFIYDKRFGESKFKALYRLWVKNSLNGEIADGIFVYEEDGIVMGFLTYKISKDSAKIGLIAVDESVQAKGIGSKLVDTLESYVRGCGIFNLEVFTQSRNYLACRFYEKKGFLIREQTNVYHLWK